MQPETLRWKVFEPVLLLGKQRFSNVDIRIRVKGGGQVSQMYAIRQAISKGIVAFYQKCERCAGRAAIGRGGGRRGGQAQRAAGEPSSTRCVDAASWTAAVLEHWLGGSQNGGSATAVWLYA